MFEEVKGLESWYLAGANLSQGNYTNKDCAPCGEKQSSYSEEKLSAADPGFLKRGR